MRIIVLESCIKVCSSFFGVLKLLQEMLFIIFYTLSTLALFGWANFISYKAAFKESVSDFEEVYYRRPDTSKLKRYIGFKPRHDMDAIIRDIIRFFREKR